MYFIFGCVLFLWLVELINLFLGHRLCEWGLYPRTISGLIGIPLSPFLHYGIGHLFMNTVPFLVLGGLIVLRGFRIFLELSLFIIFFGGALLWLFGRSSFHVGASSLIFGYFGFLVSFGWYDRRLSSLIVSLCTLFFYGGLVWGVLPLYATISWEGHLFGLIAGVCGAWLKKNR